MVNIDELIEELQHYREEKGNIPVTFFHADGFHPVDQIYLNSVSNPNISELNGSFITLCEDSIDIEDFHKAFNAADPKNFPSEGKITVEYDLDTDLEEES